MSRDIKAIDEKVEIEKGRIALWLDPNDIAFLANEWRKIPENASEEVKVAWERIAFRASSALHKEGLKFEPVFPDDSQKYTQS